MNTPRTSILEGRVRGALADHAARSPIDPDAWAKTVARSRRRFPLILPAWLPAGLVIPAAAAVAVAVVVLAATTLTGREALPGSPGGAGTATRASTGASASPDPYGTPAAPPGPGDSLYDLAPPITPMIELTMKFPGQTDWYFVWLGRATRPVASGAKSLLCFVVYVGNRPAGGWTTPAPHLKPHQVARIQGGIGSVLFGIAAPEVTSLTVQLPTGGQPGLVKSGRDFPYKVWLANTAEHGTTRLIFRDAAGQQVTQLTQNLPALPVQPRDGGITVFGASGDTMIAYRRADSEIGFWDADGNVTGWLSDRAHPLAVLENWHDEIQWFGWAPAEVARIGIRVGDGPVVTVRTIAGWPGSGIRLWGPLDEPADGTIGDTMLITYDAAGQILAQLPLRSAIYPNAG
jgi:hypothetical protein